MKKVIRFLNLSIPGKVKVETRISFDERSETITTQTVDPIVGIRVFPWMSITIQRPYNPEEKSVWNPNDSLGLNTYTLPIFMDNLIGMQKDLKIPELYKYMGSKLEVDTAAAEKIRRVFMVGNNTVELTAVVIEQPDESKVEGIKMKFNNEQSVALLSLNDIEAMIYTINRVNMDTLSAMAYFNFYKADKEISSIKNNNIVPLVDIQPITLSEDE